MGQIQKNGKPPEKLQGNHLYSQSKSQPQYSNTQVTYQVFIISKLVTSNIGGKIPPHNFFYTQILRIRIRTELYGSHINN